MEEPQWGIGVLQGERGDREGGTKARDPRPVHGVFIYVLFFTCFCALSPPA